MLAAEEAGLMASRKNKGKRPLAKMVLRLPDLEQSKNAALNSLAAQSSQESCRRAIEEFIGWYCSEPRLSVSRTVVLRYRFFLEHRFRRPGVTLAASRNCVSRSMTTSV